MEELEKASYIRGFHVYQNNWTPILGKRLVCKNEPGNPRDRYAVAVCKAGDERVGHLPRNISTMCLIFIQCSGIIYCTISGKHWKKFAGKLSRLETNPQKTRKFYTANDLHYSVQCYLIPLQTFTLCILCHVYDRK